MQAKYRGKCAGNGDEIRPGETILKDGRGWSHPGHRGGGTYEYINRTVGRMAADEFDEAAAARQERARDEAEYQAGIEDANRWRFNRDMFGEEFAANEEFARDLAGLNGDW